MDTTQIPQWVDIAGSISGMVMIVTVLTTYFLRTADVNQKQTRIYKRLSRFEDPILLLAIATFFIWFTLYIGFGD